MPFGISSAPEFFQRSMEKILQGLQGVICMMDDVLVFGKDETEHWRRLRAVLERIKASGMTLSREKCEFGVDSIKFLGHLVSVEGVKVDPDKVKAICDLTPPTCKKEARRFVGMVNYLNKFSGKLASLSSCIYEVTGSQSEWYWGCDQQKAFEDIKTELMQAPVLCAFDVTRKHRVSSDASKNAIGAVLLQLNQNDEWQPVEYASRKLTATEGRYAMIEKEALGITWACEKFDFYLVGREFEVETDHKPLISLLGEKDLSQLPLRIQRFKMRLLRYDFNISFTPGSRMYIADFLSRPNEVGVADRDISNCKAVECYVASCLEDNLRSSFQEQEILNAVHSDADCLKLLDFIKNGWHEESCSLNSELKHLYVVRDRFTLYGDIIMFDSKVFIPTSLRGKYLELCHEGHLVI
jgi:hypothetical protein